MSFGSIFKAYDVRGKVGTELTPEVATKIGKAFGAWLPQSGPVAVGRDMRPDSGQLADGMIEGLRSQGRDVWDIGEVTSDMIYFATGDNKLAGGVMITASHNPPAFNGFKLKAWFGGSAEPSMCQAVEAMLDKNPVRARSLDDLPKGALTDVRPAHYKAVKDMVEFKLIAKSKLRFAHDPLFGVGAGCFEDLLKGTTCKVTTLNAEHNPNFGGINPEPVIQNYGRTAAFLKKHPHDICLVTDGDADRVGAMDGRGNYLSTHQLICLLLRHLFFNRNGKGRVVKALTTTSMVDKMCSAFGLELVETGVGFKYIAAEMIKGGVLLGAEESGGIGFPGHIPERDGILAGLMLLEMLAVEKVSVNKLIEKLVGEFGPHYYDRNDIHYPLEKRQALMEFLKNNSPVKLAGSPVAQVKSYDGVKFIADDTSWLMLRGSGTEPILRIYAEARSMAIVKQLLALGKRLTQSV